MMPLTTFVGRVREFADLRARLGTTRLLTLTGAGGIGKTRLALALADAVGADYPDGVWLVELGTVADPTLVSTTVAEAVGVADATGSPVQALTSLLRSRRALLVLDNCEQVADACAELTVSLLTGCDHLRVLATSRVALQIPGEMAWRVPSLGMPDAGEPADQARVAASEAVQLFLARAGLVRPGFTLGERNVAAVAAICHRLDGIPLALELAAARLRVLAVDELLDRLDGGLRLLTGGANAAPPRQRTLRATLDWSYRLLDRPAMTALQQVAVFAGGFSLSAAEAVCASEEPVLDVLERLVDHSLVEVVRYEPEVRYRLLEVVRQYAAPLLARSGTENAVRLRHATWCVALAEEAEPRLRGPEQAAWLDRLGLEHANLRAGMAWALAHGEAETGLRMAGALRPFWDFRGHLAEGRRWCESALRAHDPALTPARIKALYAAGSLATRLGDFLQATVHIEAYLAGCTATGDLLGVGRAFDALAGIAETEGDYATADRWYRRCLDILEELGDAHALAVVRANRANVAFASGDYALARTLLEDALAYQRQRGARANEALCVVNLAAVALAQDDLERARALTGEALTLVTLVDKRCDVPEILGIVAILAIRSGHPEQGARLFGAADAANDTLGVRFRRHTEAHHAPARAAGRQVLGQAAFDAALAAGYRMASADAMALAASTAGIAEHRLAGNGSVDQHPRR